MKGYVPLNNEQREAIKKLSNFFDPAQKQDPLPPDEPSSKYISAMDLLTSQEKKNLEEYEEKIESGFKTFSAY